MAIPAAGPALITGCVSQVNTPTMTTHNLLPILENLHGRFSTEIQPVLAIDPSDTVVLQILDAGWCGFGQPDPLTAPPKLEGRNMECVAPRSSTASKASTPSCQIIGKPE